MCKDDEILHNHCNNLLKHCICLRPYSVKGQECTAVDSVQQHSKLLLELEHSLRDALQLNHQVEVMDSSLNATPSTAAVRMMYTPKHCECVQH
jgi:hypothetical protein